MKKEITIYQIDGEMVETIDIINYYNKKREIDLDGRALREILRNQIRIIKLLKENLCPQKKSKRK